MTSRPPLSRAASSASSSSQISLQLDDDGIPHFQDMLARETLGGSSSSSKDQSSPAKMTEQDKELTEKLLRNAEEEQESMTMGLLHKLDQIDRQRVDLDRDMEAQSAEVKQILLHGHKSNLKREVNLTLGQVPASPCRTPASIHPFPSSPSPESRRITSLSSMMPGTPRASHNRNTSVSASSKPSLLVDYLTRSLEEAQILQSNSLALEIWANRIHELANKFRKEIIELREQLNISSHDVLTIPERPTLEDGKGITTSTTTSRGDLQTPTSTQSHHEFISPLHSVALSNRRNSKGPADAPLSLPALSSSLSEHRLYGPTPQGGFRVGQVGELKEVRKAKSIIGQPDSSGD